MTQAEPCDFCLKSQVTSTGQLPWGPAVPVHLTADGHHNLAVVIGDTILSGPAENLSSTLDPAAVLFTCVK
jgi:hypothetical protein